MRKVLIIEDEPLIRKGLRYGLDYSKFNCVVVGEAEDGQSALELLESLEPDIILVDINLPIKSGLDVLKESQHLNYSAIIISGQSDFSIAREAIGLNVVGYLLKPIDMDELKDALILANEKQNEMMMLQELKQNHSKAKKIDLLVDVRRTTDPLVIEMLKFIDEHYKEKFKINQMVNKMGYSETHLMNKFKRHTLMTFNSYLNKYRIMKSINLMNQKITDPYTLTNECGFSDYKYFKKVFKKYIGYSISDYQKVLND